MRAAGLVTAVRTLGQGVVARARALATSGPSSQSAPRTAMSAWGPAEEVDEGVERHGADWQGIKRPPYQLELMPSMDAIKGHGVTICYPRTKDVLSGHDGSVRLDDPNAFLGPVLKGRGVLNHDGLKVAAIKKRGHQSRFRDLEAIRAF